jgi:hypothetical protein
MNNSKRDSRLKGYRLEKDLLVDLHQSYPGISWRLGYKEVFDIYSPAIVLDNVSVDIQQRLCTDQKDNCKAHKEEATRLKAKGFISFLQAGVYYFLPVSSSYLTIYKRPKVTGLLLRSCITDPLANDCKRLIISYRYIQQLREQAGREALPPVARQYIKKEAYLIQAERIKKQWDDAVHKYGGRYV